MKAAKVIKEKKEKVSKTSKSKKVVKISEFQPITFEDILTVRMLVRTREDFQGIRKKMDNRIGLKADGTEQNVTSRVFKADDALMFKEISNDACRQEDIAKKYLAKVLKRFPIYNNYLKQTKGIGEIAAGWILSEFDIHKATTVSKMWQFAGLNGSMVRGQKDIDATKYKSNMGEVVRKYTMVDGSERIIYLTDELVRGDRLAPGFVSPFNQKLRTALVGVMADGFIKCQNRYALEFYYPYKERLEKEENQVMHNGKMMAWKDVSKGHRDRAAKRYMIKMFIKDLYVAWRTIENLPVRNSYQEEYLGHVHCK